MHILSCPDHHTTLYPLLVIHRPPQLQRMSAVERSLDVLQEEARGKKYILLVLNISKVILHQICTSVQG